MTRAAQLLSLGGCLASAILCACAIDDAHSAPAPHPPRTAQIADASPAQLNADAGVGRSAGHQSDRGAREVARADSLVGLTRTEVKARRGSPTEQHGDEWVYTRKQAGCRDRIEREVVRFEHVVVARVSLRSKQTNKVCGGPPRFAPRGER
jgi:hypothetical protein